jgi:branched-chain amino acid transport system ATP-binding protein
MSVLRSTSATHLLLQVRGLTKRFGGLSVVNGVDFDIPEGQIVGLIGPNGAGKSTIVNMITGVYKPDGGTVTFDGHQIQGKSTHHIGSMGITRTFQIPKPMRRMTALENVLVGATFGRGKERNREAAKAKALEILEQVGLAGRSNVLAQGLTPSECRRLEIARAMATLPKLLMLDEVMAGLSTAESDDMMTLIRKLRDTGLTLLMIEHVMRVVMKLCDRIVVIESGEKICEGLPNQVMNDERVVTAYLGRGFSRK